MAEAEVKKFSASMILVGDGTKVHCYVNVWHDDMVDTRHHVVDESFKVLLDGGEYDPPEWIREALVACIESL